MSGHGSTSFLETECCCPHQVNTAPNREDLSVSHATKASFRTARVNPCACLVTLDTSASMSHVDVSLGVHGQCVSYSVCVFFDSCICMKVFHIKFHMQILAFMLTSTHIHAHLYMHTGIHTNIHTHTHTHTCTHILTVTHTHTLSHAHTLSLSLSLSHTNTHTMYCTQGHHQFLRRELFNFFFFFDDSFIFF